MAIIESELGPLDDTPIKMLTPSAISVVICGPSGVGKDSLVQRLKELRPDLHFVVTATTRAKRAGEVEGKDYYFVSKPQFEQWIGDDQLLEHAVVYGEYKGIPRQHVQAALDGGTDVVLRLDVQGAATLRRLMPEVVSVFVAPDSETELVRRLVARKTETMDKLLVRIQTARQELKQIRNFDYVVVNRDGQLDACAMQLSAIIDGEKCKIRH